MKTIFAILLMCFTSSAFAQAPPPVEGEGDGPVATLPGPNSVAGVDAADNCEGKTGFGAYNCGEGASTSDSDSTSSTLDGGWSLRNNTGTDTGKVGQDPGATGEQ